MNFQRGDKVSVYDDDLLLRPRNATVVYYAGRDKKNFDIYMVEFRSGARSVVRGEWLKLHVEPMMDDAREYLNAINALSDQ